MGPVLSVIIPVYNAEKYLAECLDSVCAQTLRNIEIICVDDGSTDGSPAILADYAARDPRIRVITQPNRGELGARESGIAAASGDWLGFIDSDDSVIPEMFEHLVNNGEKYQVDISHCGILFIYPDVREVPHFGTGLLKLQDHINGIKDLLSGDRIEPSMCCKIYRRHLFTTLKELPRIENNGDFYCNFLLFNKADSAVYEDFCGYRYRQHSASVSANWYSVKTMRGVLNVRKRIVEESSPEIRDTAYRLWLSTLVYTINRTSINPEPEAHEFLQECLNTLKGEQSNLSILSRKQRFAANMQLNFPSLIRFIYRIYGKYAIYRYEH